METSWETSRKQAGRGNKEDKLRDKRQDKLGNKLGDKGDKSSGRRTPSKLRQAAGQAERQGLGKAVLPSNRGTHVG